MGGATPPDPVATDPILDGRLTLPPEHYEIHEGEYWTAVHRFTGVAQGATVRLAVRAGATEKPHVLFAASGSLGPMDVSMQRHPVISNDGTAIAPTNHSGPDAPESAVFHTPTVGTAGDEYFQEFVGAQRVSSATRASDEAIPAVDSWVLCEVTNNHNQAQNITIMAAFYEED